MSCFPSTKAWRSLITSSLQKLRRPRTLGRAATLLLRRSSQSLYSYMQRKKKRKFHKRRVLLHHHHHHHHQSFAPVYVDDLFQHQPVAEQAFEKSSMNDISGAGASSISSPSTVDARAEMFIAKFKEEMRLQRQRSLEKYQEMLARGV